jgi:hypothetical protein
MSNPFERGNAWFMYSKLEKDFLETTSYVALETGHCSVWSEKFGELLTRTGDLVDSFFRLMISSKSLDGEKLVQDLRQKIMTKKAEDPDWFPKISDFRVTFNPIFRFSDAEVDANYGLTPYGKLHPFRNFDTQSPPWWEPYNKVKHEIFQEMEKKATLENSLNALAALFVLIILHKESQSYLVRYTDTMFAEFLQRRQIEKALASSFVGITQDMHAFKFVARTQLFTHIFRDDPDHTKKVGSLY